MVVGRVVPIAVEGGGERKGYASWRSNNTKPFIRRRSSSLGLKQITRKGSRSNLISVQVQIQLEGEDEDDSINESEDEKENFPAAAISPVTKKLEKQSSSGRLPLRVVPGPAYRRPTASSRASAATVQPPLTRRPTQPILTRRASINKLLAAKPKNQTSNLVDNPEVASPLTKPATLANNKSAKLASHSRRISLENVNKPPSSSTGIKSLNTIQMILKQPVTVVETVFENDTSENETKKSATSGVAIRSATKKDDRENLVSGSQHTKKKEPLQNVTLHFNSQENNQKEKQNHLSTTDEQKQFSTFEIELLEGHNKCRGKHGVKPLQLDKKLCEYSQKWADKLARLDVLEHSGSHQYGENLYCAWNSDPSWRLKGEVAVDSWYSEVTQHKYGRKARNPETGHFTQVIWKNSEDLGIGLAKSKSGKMIVVCNYSPAGNFIGQYKENVPKPIEVDDKVNHDKEYPPNSQTNQE